MNLFKTIFKEFKGKLLLCALFSILTGLSNGLLLVITSELIANRDYRLLYGIAAFSGMLLIWGVFRYSTSVAITWIVETLIVRLRLLILGDLQNCGLETYEGIGRAEINNALTEDCTTISRYIPDLIELISAAITIMVCLIYLVWISPFAFLVIVILLCIGTPLYLFRQQSAKKGLSASRSQIDVIYGLILDFLHGFKELKINLPKRHDLFANFIVPGFDVTRRLRINAHKSIQVNYSLGMSLFFIYLGLILFYFPYLYPDEGDVVSRIAIISLYLIVPGSAFLYGALQMVPLKVAMENIEALHSRVIAGRVDLDLNAPGVQSVALESFEDILLEDLQYTYPATRGQTPFVIGPISLSLKSGQILFITGGNGSGKTTLCKLISGLYLAQEGHILVDGKAVLDSDLAAYRALFAPVFSDFHLFDRLYGIGSQEQSKVEGWLKRFRLSDKVSIEGGRLSTIHLSSGQRRRLALLAAVLEDRPILILDEITADQEMEFRQYFYSDFLPQMKEEGKTVVIITHDDRYFDFADQLLKLEYGRLL